MKCTHSTFQVYGLVYVVDSSALSRIEENRQMVQTLVEHKDLVGKPILFLLNKKDLPEAMDEMQFSEQFELHNMAKRNKTDIRVVGFVFTSFAAFRKSRLVTMSLLCRKGSVP